MSERKLEIAWMYPDTLYLHGERGNIMALVRYAMELGMTPHVRRIDLGVADFDPLDFDILFFGPGEISSFGRIIDDISRYRHTLAEFIAKGKVLIATGTTVTMFGEKIVRLGNEEGSEGEIIDGLCIIPAAAYERDQVYGDDLYTRAEYNGYSMELVGSQIQMADFGYSETEQYRRFGTVIYGRGNNGSDGIEGAVLVNSVFTGMLGPVLVNNPWLTVRLLETAASMGGIRTNGETPKFNLELKSLKLKKQFIVSKNTV